MCAKVKQEAQNPLILRCHRLMEAFAKSDDERDFYIDRLEGFIIYVDLDKSQTDLDVVEKEIKENADRYCSIPKLSFYETKKIMEGFVNEKVYDIDTKEKLLDIIQSKEARENFLEFIYDHHAELEKWQQFYQERSRIRIIEWLRQNHFHFVFEEDLDLPRQIVEKIKQSLFQSKVGKDILNARKVLVAKAKTYYSNEALNPRPKRGRPPKQAIKQEIEPQISIDIYTTVSPSIRPFLFTPDPNSSLGFSAFSSKFETDEDLFSNRRQNIIENDGSLTQKLASLRALSSRWTEPSQQTVKAAPTFNDDLDDEDEEDFDEDFDFDDLPVKPKKVDKKLATSTAKNKKKNVKKSSASNKPKNSKPKAQNKVSLKKEKVKPKKVEKTKTKRIMPQPDKQAKNRKPLKKILPTKQRNSS